MEFNEQRVVKNVLQAATEDLLDRITVDREGMEPEAVDIIEHELRRRGVHAEAIEAHRAALEVVALRDGAGLVRRCQECSRPAVIKAPTWHRLWGVVPLFPRTGYYCKEHGPRK